MKLDELEVEASRLGPQGRARLAGRLIQSLGELSPEESTRIGAEDAERRAAALDAGTLAARSVVAFATAFRTS